MQQRDVGVIEGIFSPTPRAKQGNPVPSFEARGSYIENEVMSANEDDNMLVNKGMASSADEGTAGPSKEKPIKHQRIMVQPTPVEYGHDGPHVSRRCGSCDETVTMDTNQGPTPTEEEEEVRDSSAMAWEDVVARARGPPQTGSITCVKKAILDVPRVHIFMNHHFGCRTWHIKVSSTVVGSPIPCAFCFIC